MKTLWLVVTLASSENYAEIRNRAEWFYTAEQACTFAEGHSGTVLKIEARKRDDYFLKIVKATPVECLISVRVREVKP